MRKKAKRKNGRAHGYRKSPKLVMLERGEYKEREQTEDSDDRGRVEKGGAGD